MIDWTLVAIVAFAALVLYVVERYTRGKKIEVADATKLGILSAGLTGGVLYAVGGDAPTATSIVETAQEMFVGKPSF
jgi:hypothetical protein